MKKFKSLVFSHSKAEVIEKDLQEHIDYHKPDKIKQSVSITGIGLSRWIVLSVLFIWDKLPDEKEKGDK